jgi:hypothetical protein
MIGSHITCIKILRETLVVNLVLVMKNLGMDHITNNYWQLK